MLGEIDELIQRRDRALNEHCQQQESGQSTKKRPRPSQPGTISGEQRVKPAHQRRKAREASAAGFPTPVAAPAAAAGRSSPRQQPCTTEVAAPIPPYRTLSIS